MAARSTLTVTSGTTITSAWGNSVRDHVVPRTTSNDVTSEGMLAVNTSTDQLVVYTGSTARELARYGAITAFTNLGMNQGGVGGDCTCTASTGSGWSRSGPWIDAILNLTWGANTLGAGASGAPIYFTSTDLPNPPATLAVGKFTFLDSGTAAYEGAVEMTSAGRLYLQCDNRAAYLGQDPAFQATTVDYARLVIRYAVS